MAYVQEDLTRIDTAINDFIAGTRMGSVKFRDGREVSFATVSLSTLQGIRSKIIASLNRANRPRTNVFHTSKGL
jgi:hypothetical protein